MLEKIPLTPATSIILNDSLQSPKRRLRIISNDTVFLTIKSFS